MASCSGFSVRVSVGGALFFQISCGWLSLSSSSRPQTYCKAHKLSYSALARRQSFKRQRLIALNFSAFLLNPRFDLFDRCLSDLSLCVCVCASVCVTRCKADGNALDASNLTNPKRVCLFVCLCVCAVAIRPVNLIA